MMGAALLISFTGPKSPLFAMARAAGAPRTPPHPNARRHTHRRALTNGRPNAPLVSTPSTLPVSTPSTPVCALTNGRPNAPHTLAHACAKPIARTRTHPPTRDAAPLPSLLRPLCVADIGHGKLFCEEFCAGADVHAETHSRAVLGQEVRGTMSTRGSMWGTQSTVTGVP